MSLLLYLAAAAATLALIRRIRPFNGWVAFALIALPMLAAGHALVTGGVYAGIDLAYVEEPFASRAAEAGVPHVLEPRLAPELRESIAWNAALRSGDATLAPAAPRYHPVTLLGLLLPEPDALTLWAALLLFLAAIGAYLFARELTGSDLPALIAGASWMASTAVVLTLGVSRGYALVLLPLVLVGVRRVAREPKPSRAALLVVSMLLVLLSANVEMMLWTLVLAVAYALFEARTRLAWKYIVGSVVMALLLGAFALLPLFDALDSLPVPALQNPNTGSIAIALALYGLWRGVTRERWLLAILGVIGLFAGAGALAIAILAAIGVDRWLREPSARRLAFVLAIVAIVAVFASPEPTSAFRAAAPPLLAALALYAIASPRRVMSLVFALLLLQRAGEISELRPTLPRRAYFSPIEGLPQPSKDDPFRVVGEGGTLPPYTAWIYGLDDGRSLDASPELLSTLNVRYKLATPSDAPPPNGWEHRGRFVGFDLLENMTVRQRAYVPVWLGRVLHLQQSGSRLKIRVRMKKDGWVLVSNRYRRGWRVESMHADVPVRKGRHSLLALWVPEGEHDLTLRYEPPLRDAGAMISLVTVAVLAYFAWRRRQGAMPSSAMTFFMSFQTSFLADGVRRR